MAMSDSETPKTNAASDHGKTVLILNIDIGEGNFDQLIVHEEDEPIDLAKAFCRKHGLGVNISRALTQQIESNIDELIREQCELSTVRAGEGRDSPGKRGKTNTKPAVASVFEKLHKQGARPPTAKADPPPPKSLSPRKKPAGYSNLGHKLYYKGVKSKETMEYKRKEANKMKEDQLNQSLTFRPQINKKSGQMANRSPKHRPEEELIRKGQRAREAIDRKREQRLAADVAGLTFVPGINTRSRSQDTFRSLFEDSARRKERLEDSFSQHMTTECPFHPNVKTVRDKSEDPVEIRLLKYQHQVDENLEKTREYMHQLRDEVTGQAFFRPKTGRSPRKLTHKKDYSEDSDTHGSPRKPDLNRSVEWKYTKGKSEQMVLKRKQDRLRELFEALHPDERGCITAQNMVVEEIETDILKVVAPVLEAMDNEDQSLNFPEFVDTMEEFLKTLTPDDKAIVMGFRRKVEQREEPRHAPEIKPFKFSRAYEDRLNQPLYDRLLSAKKATEAKVKEEKDRKFQAEMAECSFRPKIQPHIPAPIAEVPIDPQENTQ